MSRIRLAPALLGALLATAACLPSTGSRVGDGAVGGAVLGAAAGQALGGDSRATVFGAAAGAAVGAAAASDTAPRGRTCIDGAGRRFSC